MPGTIDLRAVAAALEPLRTRPDLPGAQALAAVVGLRLGELDPGDARYACEAIDGAQAEAWYHTARAATGADRGAWDSCLKRARSALTAADPDAVTPRADAAVLMLLAGLALNEPVGGGVDFDAPPELRAWLDALPAATQFLRASWRKPATPGRSPLTGHAAPAVLVPGDAALVRFVTALRVGDPSANEDWLAVRGWPAYFYWGLPLLRARYAKWVGDEALCDQMYQVARDDAKRRGDDRTAGIIIEEWA